MLRYSRNKVEEKVFFLSFFPRHFVLLLHEMEFAFAQELFDRLVAHRKNIPFIHLDGTILSKFHLTKWFQHLAKDVFIKVRFRHHTNFSNFPLEFLHLLRQVVEERTLQVAIHELNIGLGDELFLSIGQALPQLLTGDYEFGMARDFQQPGSQVALEQVDYSIDLPLIEVSFEFVLYIFSGFVDDTLLQEA